MQMTELQIKQENAENSAPRKSNIYKRPGSTFIINIDCTDSEEDIRDVDYLPNHESFLEVDDQNRSTRTSACRKAAALDAASHKLDLVS